MHNISFQALQAPLFASVLFIVLSASGTYNVTNDYITEPILGMRTHRQGVPTRFGLVLHALVYFALVYSFLHSK